MFHFKHDLKLKFFVFVFFLFYLLVVWHYSANVPFFDDYDALLQDLFNLINAPTFSSFVKILFAQHNEHRIMTTRLVDYLEYLCLGQVDFKILVLLGNLYFLGTFCLLFSTLKNRTFPTVCLLTFFFFQLTYWEIVFHAMMSLSLLAVIFFAFLALFLLHRSLVGKDYSIVFFILAGFSSFLATFSNGNGMFVFVPGLIMLFLSKAYRRFACYLLIAIFSISTYFYGYQSIHSPHFSFYSFIFALSFLGGIIGSPFLSFVLGAFGLFVFYRFVRTFMETGDFAANLICYYVIFIILTAFAAALNRLDVAAPYSSRYTVYSVLFFSCLLVLYFNQTKLVGWILAAIIVVMSINNFYYGIAHGRANLFELNAYTLNSDGSFSDLIYPVQSWPNQILKEVAPQRLYILLH